MKIQQDYFSNLSCYEEFVIKANLLGYDVHDKEVLTSLKKIENYYVLFTDRIYMFDENGNVVEDAVVEGNFDCSNCTSLTSLKGGPKEVGRDFYCSYCNSLISLKGSPKEVGGGFYCEDCNSLTSYETDTIICGKLIR